MMIDLSTLFPLTPSALEQVPLLMGHGLCAHHEQFEEAEAASQVFQSAVTSIQQSLRTYERAQVRVCLSDGSRS